MITILRNVEALSRFRGRPRRSPLLWFAEAEEVGLRVALEITAIHKALARLDKVQQGAAVADLFAPLLNTLFTGAMPVRFRFWDGSEIGSCNGPGTLFVTSPTLLTRLVWSPGELGLARGFISEEFYIEGDAYETLRVMREAIAQPYQRPWRIWWKSLGVALQLGALHRPPPPPQQEIRLTGVMHSRRRDAAAVRLHYDVGDDFYKIVLGPSMTYSCAHFEQPNASLEHAQAAKHELVCRKLGLHERTKRLLDVGCGWGSMAMYAARHYGSEVVGITLSPSQASMARQRIAEAGLADRIEIRLQDYRNLAGDKFDAISSIGMFEHVGEQNMAVYFESMFRALAPEGRLLNHAISKYGTTKLRGSTFMNRYVFPDGELVDVAEVQSAMERVGLEIRDVESMREHYSMTLHAWVHNLESSWKEAVASADAATARVWWLYMSLCANAFDNGSIAIHQVLAIAPVTNGKSGMPLSRSGW